MNIKYQKIKRFGYRLMIRFIRKFSKRLFYLIKDSTYRDNSLNSELTGYKKSGEFKFYESIQDKCKVIFDVGCRNNSLFLNKKNKIVHYFEPVKRFITYTKKVEKNINSKFNCFGLSNINAKSYFYPTKYTFTPLGKINNKYNPKRMRKGKRILELKRADNYIIDNKVKEIDFLKIDVEGYELNVIKGFGKFLNIVKFIQFEYSHFYIDNDITLKDVIEYLYVNSFKGFSVLTTEGKKELIDYSDNYITCNIVCYNSEITNDF